MNKEAIQKTIDLMKNPPPDLYFNMHDAYSRGVHGAKACIAGFADHVAENAYEIADAMLKARSKASPHV